MRLREQKVPAWADKLIGQICQEERISRPRVTWMKRSGDLSTGIAWAYTIRFRAGTNRKDQKHCLIHELVHSIMGQRGKGNCHHNEEFYAKLFELGKRHGVGAAYIKQRENWYKPRGVKQGYSLYLRRLREKA